jgi:FkbM family methyltransferase
MNNPPASLKERIVPPARTAARITLSTALNLIPLEALQPLRRSYPNSPPGSSRERLQSLLLGVVRYRGVPRSVDSFALADNPEVKIACADSFVAERLYWFGEKKGYEPEVLRWWKDFCARSTNILELGTNIGYFAVQGALANPGARYTAVEPHPGAAASCRRNLELNGITSVTLLEAAAVADPSLSSVELHLPGVKTRDHYAEAPSGSFAGGNELHHQEVEDVASYPSITVEAQPLAGLLPGVDLLKMDIEGQEHSLLSSVVDQLAASRPAMFLEVLEGTTRLRQLISELCDTLGYRLYVPTSTSLIPLEASELPGISLENRFQTKDLVMVCEPEHP